MGATQGLFLSSLAHIIPVVSEEKLKIYKVEDGQQMPDNGLQVMAKLHPDNKTCIRKIAIYLSHKLNKL